MLWRHCFYNNSVMQNKWLLNPMFLPTYLREQPLPPLHPEFSAQYEFDLELKQGLQLPFIRWAIVRLDVVFK